MHQLLADPPDIRKPIGFKRAAAAGSSDPSAYPCTFLASIKPTTNPASDKPKKGPPGHGGHRFLKARHKSSRVDPAAAKTRKSASTRRVQLYDAAMSLQQQVFGEYDLLLRLQMGLRQLVINHADVTRLSITPNLQMRCKPSKRFWVALPFDHRRHEGLDGSL